MSHLRTFRNWLSVTLAFLIGVPWLPLSAPRAAMAASAPAARSFNTTIAQTSTVDFKPALDLLVSRSLNSLGWQVNSIQSQLNSPAPAEGATRQSGQGNWTIQAQDEQSQTLTLNGSLDFQISGQSQPDYSLDGAVTISGTLSGSNVSVLLTTDQSNHVTLDQLGNATTNIIVTLTRDGQTSTTHLKATTASKAIAYNLDQATTQVTVDRAGQVYTWNQTVTARDFGKGESEIWLHATFTGGTSTAGDTTIDQHSFQHVDSNGVSVDYERYDIQVGDNHYHLKAPAQARTTLDGQIASDLVLVDQQGNPIGQIGGQISEVGGHGLLSPALGRAMLASLTAVEPASSLRTCADAAGFLASVGWSFLFGLAFAIALGNPITGAAAMWILIGATASAGIGLAAAQGEANAKTQDEKDAIAEKAFIMQFVMAAMTGGGASGTAGGAGRGVLGKAVSYLPGQAVNQAARNVASGSSCNADPFFLYPDIRPGGGTGSTPLQVLRVSGGLISTTTTLASSSEVTASIPASLGHFEQYSDRPELFVGSAVPAGATTIGAWQWDTAHTFGAGVSHTQSPVDGSQKHYFIHASQPLSVTADDNLIQYVYLDPQHPPKEIYLQFYTGDGNGEHRAYWGVDEAQTGGAAGSTALFPMGSLPPTGGARLPCT